MHVNFTEQMVFVTITMPKPSGGSDGVPKPTGGSDAVPNENAGSDEDVKIVPKPWMLKRGIRNNINWFQICLPKLKFAQCNLTNKREFVVGPKLTGNMPFDKTCTFGNNMELDKEQRKLLTDLFDEDEDIKPYVYKMTASSSDKKKAKMVRLNHK